MRPFIEDEWSSYLISSFLLVPCGKDKISSSKGWTGVPGCSIIVTMQEYYICLTHTKKQLNDLRWCPGAFGALGKLNRPFLFTVQRNKGKTSHLWGYNQQRFDFFFFFAWNITSILRLLAQKCFFCPANCSLHHNPISSPAQQRKVVLALSAATCWAFWTCTFIADPVYKYQKHSLHLRCSVWFVCVGLFLTRLSRRCWSWSSGRTNNTGNFRPGSHGWLMTAARVKRK